MYEYMYMWDIKFSIFEKFKYLFDFFFVYIYLKFKDSNILLKKTAIKLVFYETNILGAIERYVNILLLLVLSSNGLILDGR